MFLLGWDWRWEWLFQAGLPVAQAEERPLLQLDTGGHMADITGLAFTPDGQFIVSASRDKVIRVWDWRTGKTVRTIRGQSVLSGNLIDESERRVGELRAFVKKWRSGMPSLCDLFGTDNDAIEAESASQHKSPLFATITQLRDKIAARQTTLEQSLQQSQRTPRAATAVRCLQPDAWVAQQEAWKPL